ncbi:HET-domain-containing protein [Coniochaeta ligniaria NRRL 30616]|uniref:HET-domain-containing protein n=1 Tax=Coniochaeta ligniaria NRRL 30616 TaxID=1408157 RepID=A0A1J7JF20_9PEZI|nr:HET-domain-containing protein [Coniochaeta ligniaria NRRL 30616]
MRLLNTTTLTLTTFPASPSRPQYAILSHTWGRDEAPFDVFACKSTPLARIRRRRYPKVVRAAALARAQGYGWIWIDTCCIDKSSSAELSEAINSMYGWYEGAGVCYAYLVDVPPSGQDVVLEALVRSRWFTRGWTLQELVAPPHLEFYDAGWNLVGTKAGLADTLEGVTRIPASLRLLSVAQRMAWVGGRETTRAEDMAYCLMGLFGVHMPLLYGEGEERAFRRLQGEIARGTNDQIAVLLAVCAEAGVF